MRDRWAKVPLGLSGLRLHGIFQSSGSCSHQGHGGELPQRDREVNVAQRVIGINGDKIIQSRVKMLLMGCPGSNRGRLSEPTRAVAAIRGMDSGNAGRGLSFGA